MKCDLLIQRCTLLMPDFSFKENQTIAINRSIIHAIGDSDVLKDTYDAAETIDASHKLVMPGFVDGHTHTCQQYLRGRTASEFPMLWTRILVPFESNLSPEDAYHSALLSCLEMIKSGTTAFADSGSMHMKEVAKAAAESGMRAAIARSTMDMGAAISDKMKESPEDAIARNEELFQEYQGAGNGRIDIWFAIRQVMTCSPKLIRMVVEKANEHHTGIHAHLCEHKDEVNFCLSNYRKRPAQLLNDLGALGPNLLTAHNVLLSDSDISLLAEHNVKIIHCPRTNYMNHGFPNVRRILSAGASVGLGCDGACRINLSIFDEMKHLLYTTIAHDGLPVFDPFILTAPDMLRMATAGGAAAIGHADDIGTVEEGKKADLILLDLDQPHLNPTYNLANTIVDCASGHDVTDSIIDGKVVMRNRKVLTLDEEKIIYESRRRMGEIYAKAGL